MLDKAAADQFESVLKLAPNYTVETSRRYVLLLLNEYERQHTLFIQMRVFYLKSMDLIYF